MKNRLFVAVIGLFVALSLFGCDAFVRKFTRKKKKEQLPQEQIVIEPQEYRDTATPEEKYRQYFLYWKAWQDELIEALTHGKNFKKQVDCAKEASKSILQARGLLNAGKQKELDIWINKLADLKSAIEADPYCNDIAVNRLKAEHIKKMILREFSFSSIKDALK